MILALFIIFRSPFTLSSFLQRFLLSSLNCFYSESSFFLHLSHFFFCLSFHPFTPLPFIYQSKTKLVFLLDFFKVPYNSISDKVLMQGKLFQRCAHLLYCSVLFLGGNVNTRRMSRPAMGSIFHIKNQ